MSAPLEISAAFPPGPDVVAHAQTAERLGYKRVWLYDSPALYPDVWVTLADVARHTERVEIGPAVLVPSLRHPVTQAAAIATLASLAPARVVVAIGTGFTGRMALGQRPLPWEATRVYIAQVKALLQGESVVIDGSAVQLIPSDGFFPEFPIEVPISVAANGPKGTAVAHELGDGVMRIFGGDPSFDWCSLLVLGTVLDDDERSDSDRALAAAGPALSVVYHGMYEADPAQVEVLPGGAAWRAELERLPEHSRHLTLHRDHLVKVTERDRALMSGSGLESFTWTGTARVLRDRLRDVAAAGTSEVLYAPMGPDVERELRMFMNMASS